MPARGAGRRSGAPAASERRRAPASPLRTVLLVGGAGRMGRLLARAFRAAGHAVAIHDPGRRLAGFPSVPLETAAGADAVVVSVALDATPAVLAEVLALSPPGLVLDVASVKGPLLPLYAKAARRGLRVASVHPMFGPGVRTLAGQNLIVCDAGVPAAARAAARLFSGQGLKLATLPIGAHDAWVARTLGLAHLLSLLAGSTLAREGVRVKSLDGLASTSFRNLCLLAAPILHQAPDLTLPIQARNPATPGLFDLLDEELASWRALVERNDLAAFDRKLAEARSVLAAPVSVAARRRPPRRPSRRA
ncbi:MAG TPA: prephenate dehydrogenase/arogenate dehydrogenase family protein [Thermoanaerobaculia bacterium]|nr:prephenate dehydrogenase/arogenate dehydrogenase family protein [Thermoanaerobaculia bacterium]